MRRVISIIAGIVLLVAAAGWSYLAYRQYRSYQTLIPWAATSVIRIQVDALATDIAWNALWNADHYRGSPLEGRVGVGRKSWNRMGIAIPANVFLYQIDHPQSAAFPDVFFGSLPLADSAAFAGWLASESGMQVRQDTLGTVALSEQAVIRFKAQEVLFALSPARAAKDLHLLTGVLDTLLLPRASVPVSESPFSEIQHRDGHLCILGKYDAAVDFKKGAVLFSVRRETDPALAAGGHSPHFADSNAASLWFQGPLNGLLSGRQFHIGTHTLHGDSLLSHYRGRMVMEWRGTVIQQDTVIGYDYDENFNMIERQEVVERRIPAIYLSLLADTGLRHYLQTQEILNATGNGINRDVFPLFQVGVGQLDDGYLRFHTAPSADAPPEADRGGHGRFHLSVNFSKMNMQEIAPLAAPFIQRFDRLEAHGQTAADRQQRIRGKLLMKDQRINSLVQLLMPPPGEEQPPAL